MGNRELINRFLAYLKREGKAVLTLSAYATDLKQLERALNNKKIVELNEKDIEGLPRHFVARNDLKINSLARKLTSVREFLKWGYQKGYLENDLAKLVVLLKRDSGIKSKSISSVQLNKLRKNADVKERLVLELILAGMKLSEIVKIKMKSLSRHNSLFVISNSAEKIQATEYLQQAMEYYLATYSRGPRSNLIFSQRTGRAITTRTASNILNKLVKKIGLIKITAKSLNRSLKNSPSLPRFS